ncbi:MAG: uroporphyrinogen-III C-methyltransferase [Neisseriaceae bacterium]|nr:uroporphyrinogen-III C-methyltransferase [Neisseriaceae bacterium]MBP6862260.1 uroporphyrinogen-III C-methyltransferase [Neisseriaceae bacterium]
MEPSKDKPDQAKQDTEHDVAITTDDGAQSAAQVDKPEAVATESTKVEASPSAAADDAAAATATEQATKASAQAVPPESKQPEPSMNKKAQPNATPTPPSPVTPTIVEVPAKSSGKGMAFGALVLSLLALGASGFLFVQGQNTLKNMDTAWQYKINQAGLEESNNQNLLQNSLQKQTELVQSLRDMNQQLGDDQNRLDTLDRRYEELTKSRLGWLLEEVNYALNMAAQQLSLSGNVPVAINILEGIESRLAAFDRPELVNLKKAVSEDLSKLKASPYLDVTGVSLKLDRLQTAVSGLPMLLDTLAKPQAASNVVVAKADVSWWQNMWQTIKTNLGELVAVRKLESSDAILMSPEQAYFVKENIRLRLLDARLALLQRQVEVYRYDLENVSASIKQYFDVNAPATQAWLKELDELRAMPFENVSIDSLSGSLEAIKGHQNTPLVIESTEADVKALDQAAPKEEAAKTDAEAPAKEVEPAPPAPAKVEAQAEGIAS